MKEVNALKCKRGFENIFQILSLSRDVKTPDGANRHCCTGLLNRFQQKEHLLISSGEGSLNSWFVVSLILIKK